MGQAERSRWRPRGTAVQDGPTVASGRLAVQEGCVARQRNRLANLARHTARGTLKVLTPETKMVDVRFKGTHVRPRQIRSQRLCSEQGLLPRGARTARRSGCLGGGADVRYRDQLKGQSVIVPVPNRGEAGASSPGVQGRKSPASRSLPSRSSEGGWQRQWRAWSPPALPRELLCSFRHWPGWAQHRSGLPLTRFVTFHRAFTLRY